MTKKHFLNIALFIVMMLGMMGCNAGYSGSQNGSGQSAVTNDSGDNPTVTDPLKATTLQSVVNNAKAGEVIDLSEYKEITDYTATIRKALTLQNGSLKGATLSVANDEVTLVGLTDLSIKTNSSVSLDGCAIETLEYTDIPDGDEGRGGRGDSKFTTTTIMFQNNASGTKITSLQLNLTDTSVSDVIDLSYYPSITDYDAVLDKTIKLNCKTSEETTPLPVVISDGSKAVNITKSGYGNNNFSNGTTKITSLEGAISLPLPGTTTTSTTTTTIKQSGTITVKGDGEVTVTNLDDKDNNKLLKITPYSGFNSIITEGQQPDFSKLIMLDTFTANNVKVFKAGGLTFEKTDTVSKLEKDFTVTINGVEYYKNGKVMSKAPLAAGKYPAKITSDYDNCDDGYAFDFTFTVMEKKVDAVLSLESITIVPNSSLKTVYKVGDRLNLNGLIVVGNYTYGDVSYQNVITDYTLTPDNGTVLQSSDNAVTVYALGKTTTVPIEVKPAYTFTFVIAKDYTVDYQVTSGETQEALKNFNVEGASFGGWFTDSSYKTEFDFDTPITQNTSVYAKWSNPIVYHNVCGAINDNPTSYTDSEDIALEDLTRTGYTFGGWYDASADGTVVTGWSAGDKAGLVELWASWTPIAYTIVLDANSGTGEPISLSAVYDESATLPTAEDFTAPVGLVFGSWNTKADGTGSSYSAGQSVINLADANGTIVTLYAQWIDKAAFKITYNNTLNADNPNPASFLESQDVTIAPLTKSGYTFGGWYDASTDGTIVTGWSAGSKTADVTLSARWTANVHNITFNNTKNVTNPNAATFRELDNVTLTNLGNTTGYTFDGWYDAADGGNKVSGWESLAQTADVTLYAHWTAIGYTIKFNANGGTGSMSNLAMTYDTAKNLTANAFTKTGYTFQGWGEAANATTAKYTDKQSVNNLTATAGATVTLYAVWKANTYTIKFNANGGSGSMSDLAMTYDTAKTLTANAFTRTGYKFVGWRSTLRDYADKASVENLTDEDGVTVTLYALWTQHTYTVVFNANGGSGSMNNETYHYDENMGLFRNVFYRSGYIFTNWNTKANGTGTSYNDKQFVKNLTTIDGATITLYAIWTKNEVSADGNFVINGEEYDYTSFTKVMSSAVTVTGSDANWSGYLENSATDQYKGVFVSGRTVKLSPYSIGTYQVTMKLYEAVMNTGIDYSSAQRQQMMNNYPQYWTNWYQAITFCNKLSILMGKNPCYTVSGITNWGSLQYSSIPTENDANWDAATVDMNANGYRLPTEAEWEFAARGGNPSAAEWKYAFSGIDSTKPIYRDNTSNNSNYGGITHVLFNDSNLSTVGWYSVVNTTSAHTVGTKTANTLGIYDMSGNVSEWCWDWYNESVTSNDAAYKVGGVVTNPMGALTGSNRCRRGAEVGHNQATGKYYVAAYGCCVSYRGYNGSLGSGGNAGTPQYTGIRLVQTVK